MSTTVVISRNNIEDDRYWEVEDALIERCAATPGLAVRVIPHLYHIADESGIWGELAAIDGPLVVVCWLHPRPAEWLLRRHGVGEAHLFAVDMAAYANAEECYRAIIDSTHCTDNAIAAPQETDEDVAFRWYPVIDYSRCIACRHCLQFCLFGVFEDESGMVVATNPGNCKRGCPACSRICPQGAIMFPLYEKDSAIAGAPFLFMTPDLNARRMYYLRTQQPCPVCGKVSEPAGRREPAAHERTCEECGAICDAPVTPARDTGLFDDIDALIDELDDITRGRS